MTSTKIGFEDPRRVLKRHGLRPKRSFGQNFLISEAAVRTTCESAVEHEGQPIVEIGAGLGTLTSALLFVGAHVTAIERDREMCDVLRAELGENPNFRLEEADAVTFDYNSLASKGPITIAGNLPYQITGQILRRILDIQTGLKKAVVMVQLEVAERLIAPAGHSERSILSVITQSRCNAKVILRLNPGAFFPPPKVRSAIVELTPLESPICPIDKRDSHAKIVKAAFSSRRKTLRNSLRSGGIGSGQFIEELLERAGIAGDLRAERLTVDQFADLTEAFSNVP